jgi:hypothetical protein
LADDGETGFIYLRNGVFSSDIVAEFYDNVKKKTLKYEDVYLNEYATKILRRGGGISLFFARSVLTTGGGTIPQPAPTAKRFGLLLNGKYIHGKLEGGTTMISATAVVSALGKQHTVNSEGIIVVK